MKKLLCLLLAAILTAAMLPALADSFVSETPNADFTEQQARAFAVAFFCEKCGLSETDFDAAEWTATFGHSSMETADESRWTITVRIDGHERRHYLHLTPAGEIILWGGHGAEYTVANPELLDSATLAEPLPSDIQKDAAVQLVMEELGKSGVSVDAPADDTEAYFAFSQHFNGGHIPVWLVQVSGADGQAWKAAVTHKGQLLSLVPVQQDFLCFTTPGEVFWSATFPGETYIEEHQHLIDVLECRIPIEERAAHTARWRPLVEAWMAEHPYYLNNPDIEYAVTIQSVYGVPDGSVISQEQAEEAAFAHLADISEGELYLTARTIRTDYFVTDPENPQWCIRVGRALQLSREEWKANPWARKRQMIRVDAHTGEIISCEEY